MKHLMETLFVCFLLIQPASAETVIDQDRDDIVLLKSQKIHYLMGDLYSMHEGGLRIDAMGIHFNTSLCLETQSGRYRNCTSLVESFAALWDHSRQPVPALHTVKADHQFRCNLNSVETVTKERAFNRAQGIGFSYNKSGRNTEITFIPKWKLHLVGKVKLKTGEPALVHRFVSASVCFEGSGTGSLSATYNFKPYLQFRNESENVTYRNWDSIGKDYQLTSMEPELDRTKALLKQ